MPNGEAAGEGPHGFVERHKRKERANAIKCVKELDRATVFFYADPQFERAGFDYGPLYRFGDVDLFVYAGREGTQDGLRESLRSIREASPVGDQLKECSASYRFKWPEENEFQLPINEMFSQPAPPLDDADWWAFMTKLSRQVAGHEHEFWLLCICGDPLLELRRLCGSRGIVPTYLALYGPNGRILHCS